MKTPYYLYDLGQLNQTLTIAREAADVFGYKIHYAIKANNNPVLTQLVRQYGIGVDCVSGNEVVEALRQGFATTDIVFAGVGKTDQELDFALESDIAYLTCESVEELEVIADTARHRNRVARVALRVNPGIEAHTHRYITTGLYENKFGIPVPFLEKALSLAHRSPWIDLVGLHFHIGSQITSFEPYIKLCEQVNRLWHEFDGARYNLKVLNLGGGLGIDYEDPERNPVAPFYDFFSVFASNLRIPSSVRVHFELGRSLVGQCGRLITKVLYVKQGVNKKFIITDAGMTELMRPALYQARHRIQNSDSPGQVEVYDVAGPICESSDVFAEDVPLPETRRGDRLAILSCGAYAESMMLNYNMRPKAGSCFVNTDYNESAEATVPRLLRLRVA